MRSALIAGCVAAACLASGQVVAGAHDGSADTQSASAKFHGNMHKLKQLRHATRPYRSGPGGPWTNQVFDQDGITCIEDPDGSGAMGIHFVDPENLDDGRVRRLAPEALIYEPGPGDSLELVAVEYLVFAEAWDAEHTRPPILYGQRFSRVEEGNRYGLPDFYELHVWHEERNPNGIFDDWNPNVHCDCG
jgi:hypothetical protein